MTLPPLDLGPLTREPMAGEVAAFRAMARQRPEYRGRGSGTPQLTALIGGIVVFAVVVAIVLINVGVRIAAGDIASVGPVLPALVLVLVAIPIAIVLTVRQNLWLFGRWRRWMRLEAFAQANGMLFSPRSAAPAYPGAIFGIGHSRHSQEHLRTAQGRFADYGSYAYTTGSGKSRRIVRWGFLALALDRALPHMVLDSVANDRALGSNLPVAFFRSQRLSLEGDFDRHFRLYCPKEYERDALYVFTPDLMALLVDEAAPFDVEIIDRWMLVYSPVPFDMADPAVHVRMRRIVDTVGAKTLDRAERYADERATGSAGGVAPDEVAPQGRRLQRGWRVAGLVAAGVMLVVFLLLRLLPGLLGG